MIKIYFPKSVFIIPLSRLETTKVLTELNIELVIQFVIVQL